MSHDAGRRPSGAACIHSLFEAQASRSPDTVALVHEGAETTYAALDARANRIARHLADAGAAPGRTVAVFLPRDADLPATLLAVLKAGAAYVPLDPAYPADRLGWTLEDAAAPVVVTTAALAPRLPPTPARIVRLDAEAAEIGARDASRPDVPVFPASLAYVIYTSGSTGRPKGVEIEHRNTVARLHWLRENVGDEERSRVLGSTSVCFDVSIAEIFGTLCWGGTLVMVENALSLAAMGEDDGIVTACMVPGAAAELLRLRAIPRTVRTLALGGEPLAPELAQSLLALDGVTRVMNLYGPTEDTTYSTCKEPAAGDARAMTVGRTLDGTTARLYDEALRPASPDADGEVFLSGLGVTRGYRGRPGATAERWVPDPQGPPGSRMYRTGDLGRWREDGDLVCLGRIDHQVKVRGYRVEPGEVEAALRAVPGVREAAVAPRGEGGSRRLVAWYAAEPDADVSPADLRHRVAAALPDYMVPSAFVRVSSLPRTPNGKVDRLALPEPDADALAREGGSAAPRTEVEERIAAVWREVLGVEEIGVDDDLFSLGGHSLRATQIVARVREAFGVDVPLPDVFRAPTVAGMGEIVEGRLAAATRLPRRIPHAPRDEPIPLSSAQEAIRFFQELSRGMRSYDFQAAIRLHGRLDVDALHRAIREIVARHEIFRTTFPVADGESRQEIHAAYDPPLPLHDLSHLPTDERDAELARRMAEEFRLPFDLEALPLVRWTLFRLGDEEHVLAQVEHHFVHDGWSFGVFLREMTTLYAAFAEGRPSPLPPPELQFADYAAWQRAWVRGGEARAHLDWWREALRGVPHALELPTDRPRPPVLTFRGAARRLRLDPRLARAAADYSRRQGVTLYMTLLAAFQATLARIGGQEAFCIGGGVAGREMRETEGIIGMVVNTVPLKADLTGDPEFREIVARVRETALAAYAHQDVPFGDIVEAVQPERSLARLPIYQVAFNFHDAPYPRLEMGGVRLEVTEAVGNGSSKFDLQVIVMPRGQQGAGAADEVDMLWEFSSDLFDAATVERWAGHYQTLLAAALSSPSIRLGDLPLESADEAREEARRWTANAALFPREATIPELFVTQAARTPDAVALEMGETVTYAELDRRANRLARHLRRLGARPEARVGVCLDRGVDLIVGCLAAMKAGAAYVPLDPEYPPERLAYMVGDAGLMAIVTDWPSARRLPPGGPHHVLVDADRDGLEGEDDSPLPLVGLFPESLAYLVYTSGSTGQPKPVAIPHRPIVRFLKGSDYLTVRAGERMSQTASSSFDAFTFEVWAALTNGATLVGIPRDVAVDPHALAATLREKRIDVAFLTTALFHQVARAEPDAFAGLRRVLFGGEAADAAAVRLVLDACGPGKLLNLYGPAEAATFSSWHPVDALAPGAAGVPIGRPLSNTTLYVLDARMNPVPAGVPGELYVGGEAPARGYFGRPGATAARFVPDPFSDVAGGRLYRTGDRVRRLADGALEFVGRADRQVKLRGFRVEPGEVEAVLAAHPGVRGCVVDPRREAEGTWTLAAWAVAESSVTAKELRGYLADRLPPYMVPSSITLLDEIPIGATGKVDRRALPAPSADVAAEAEGFVEPATETEVAIAGIWAEVLGLERVGAGDDFFDLGGHSLRATRIVARAREALGVELTVRALFEHSTVRTLAAEADRLRREEADELTSLLARLEGLDDDEVARMLAERGMEPA